MRAVHSSSLPPVRQIVLIVPGLCLPRQMLRDLSFDLPIPGLRALLANARISHYSTRDASNESPLLKAALSPELIEPAAPLRLLGLGSEPGQAPWLCLDPVHLGFRERAMVVGDPAQLALTATEANELVAALNPLFADLGHLVATRPSQWHMQQRQQIHPNATPPAFPSLASAIGSGALRTLDGLGNTPQWRTLLNEAQMLLHSHPVNQARQAQGLAAINSLWPWGYGTLPVLSEKPAPQYQVHTSNAVLQGLTFHYGQQLAPPDAGFSKAIASQMLSPLVSLDQLRTGALTGDAQAWRDGLCALDEQWFSPLYAAWQTGSVGKANIRLIFPTRNGAVREARLAPRGVASALRAWARRLNRQHKTSTLDDLADD